MKIQSKKLYKYIILLALLACISLLIIKSSIIKEVLYLILISATIAYTLKPIQWSIQQQGLNKSSSALLLIIILILIVIAIFSIIVPSIFKESLDINTTVDNIEKLIDGFYSKIKPLSSNKTIHVLLNNLYRKIDNQIMIVFTKAFDGMLNIGQNILSIAVVPIIVYYFLSDGNYIGNKLLSVFPVRVRAIIKKISRDADKILGRYIVSQLILCLIIGLATFMILIILDIDFPIILSILNAFFNIIPYFGPIFGAVPAIFIALIQSSEKALWTAVWLYILQQIEGNILSPKITGDSISMHPLIVILLLIIGGKVAGFVGMILAVPIGVIIKVIYDDLNYYLF